MKKRNFVKLSATMAVATAMLATAGTVGAQETNFTRTHLVQTTAQQGLCPQLQMLTDHRISSHELTADCRHLHLEIDASSTFFDAEYASPTAKGYSVAGFRFSPTLIYGINERAQLRAGMNAIVFAGLDSMYQIRPALSLIYQPKEWLTLIGGTLQGGFNHRLDAPVYDLSRQIFHYQEDGLQILTHTKHWNSDTWLDWHHYLWPWTADQEQFTAGTRHSITLADKFAVREVRDETNIPIVQSDFRQFSIELPLHFVVDHRGGEVKTLDTNTVSTFNERVGLHATIAYGDLGRGRCNRFSVDIPIYFYHLEDSDLDHGGKAFYPTLSYSHERQRSENRSAWSLKAVGGFWHGDHYFSAHGSPAFWSVNPYSALHMPSGAATADADVRNLLTLRLAYEHEFKRMHLGIQLDALYDTDKHKTDLLVGCYMRYKEKFRLF